MRSALGHTKEEVLIEAAAHGGQELPRIGKKDMVHNRYTPRIEVGPENYLVKADGELLMCEPASLLPMAQRYFLF